PADEKAVLQEAAVVGKVFWLGPVAAGAGLSREDAERLLHALERKEVVRRERRSSIADEAQLSFRHVLVRDVAYGQLPRPRRAQEWLGRAGELVAALPPTRTKGLVLARLASLHNVHDETEDAQRLAQAALELAEQVGSDEVRARALGAIAASRTQTGDWQGFDDYAESVELATKLRSPEAIVNIINYAGARVA